MKPRFIVVIAAALAVTGIGAWMWFGGDNASPVIPGGPQNSASNEVANPPAANGVAAPAPPVESALTEPVKPAEPARVASSVVPGMPMVREGSSPERPPSLSGAVAARVSAAIERDAPGKAELQKVQAMLRDYRTRLRENPVGSNAEIMRAVMGGNEVRAKLGPPEGLEVNDAGELLDMWGTPYFFHQISKTSMEVRSAGPDRKMWTTDDLVSK